MMTKSKPSRLQKETVAFRIIPASSVNRSFLVIAQDRPASKDFSMPEISTRTGEFNFILPLDSIAPKLEELVGGGSGLGNDRTTAKRKVSGQTLIKLVKPSFSARAKAAMIQGRK
jgi:hypothetical protein